MKYLTVITLMLIAGNLQAQDSIRTNRYSVKGYANINRTKLDEYGTGSTKTTLRPEVAFQVIDRKGNAHEFALTEFAINIDKNINLNNTPAGYRQVSTKLAFRYERIINLMKRKNLKLAPSIGYGISPFYSRIHTLPLYSSQMPYISTQWGIQGFIVPRVTYNFSKRLYADVNIPVCVLSMSHNTQKIKDPTLPAGRQKYDLTAFDMLPQSYNARIGLGIRF